MPVVSVVIGMPAVSSAIGLPNWSSAGSGAACGLCNGHGLPGCVPALNASVTTTFGGQFGTASPPLVSSICAVMMPSGGAKSTFGWPAITACMKRVQIGTAPVPPERPVGALSSKPSHVSVSAFGVKPMNHASRLSFVVPVLPAATSRNPIERAPPAVPRSTTPFITVKSMYMSRAGKTCTGLISSPAETR